MEIVSTNEAVESKIEQERRQASVVPAFGDFGNPGDVIVNRRFIL